MKYNKYRIPVLFSCVLGLFMLGVGVVDYLSTPTTDNPEDEPVIRTSVKTGSTQTDLTQETMVAPVQEGVDIVRYFYEVDGENNHQALDYFEGVYRQSKGIDYGSSEAFDVVAALSGTVTEVKKDAILGVCVTIECENGIELIYQSLANVGLEEGQSIAQGNLIGESGHNIYEADLGNHVHFTIEKDGVAVNPLDLLNKKINEIN